jgi:hypothetical protein
MKTIEELAISYRNRVVGFSNRFTPDAADAVEEAYKAGFAEAQRFRDVVDKTEPIERS